MIQTVCHLLDDKRHFRFAGWAGSLAAEFLSVRRKFLTVRREAGLSFVESKFFASITIRASDVTAKPDAVLLSFQIVRW